MMTGLRTGVRLSFDSDQIGGDILGKSKWRRERDSNPRCPFRHNGFQDRRFQPLTHPSADGDSSSITSLPYELFGLASALCIPTQIAQLRALALHP